MSTRTDTERLDYLQANRGAIYTEDIWDEKRIAYIEATFTVESKHGRTLGESTDLRAAIDEAMDGRKG